MKIGVGIIGCGYIGSELAIAIDRGEIRNAKLIAVLDEYEPATKKLLSRLNTKPKTLVRIEELLKLNEVNLVVEAASQKAVQSYAKKILESGKELMIMSSGALMNTDLYNDLESEVKKTGRRVFLPSGAIAGIDGLLAASKAGIDEVILTTRKSPKSLADSPFFVERNLKASDIRNVQTLFEGKASDAVKLFPANVNVAATLSLASLGGERTRVRVIADPEVTSNIHEVHAKGRFGEMTVVMKNVPSPSNPKTSYQAVLSAIQTLRSICEGGIKVGT